MQVRSAFDTKVWPMTVARVSASMHAEWLNTSTYRADQQCREKRSETPSRGCAAASLRAK